MFSPLLEMGKKMNVADVHNLEYIIYKREDEISSLVDAYNRMVHDLSDSTRQLAQAERDKAWSQMARQVAHEIKNPLTPIKLQIQRLIRMKQNGNPAWEKRFDEVSVVVLEHIDILTETANEFSTFAKLYSEEPVLIDLDKTLKEQLLIFDNKDNIKISYRFAISSITAIMAVVLVIVFFAADIIVTVFTYTDATSVLRPDMAYGLRVSCIFIILVPWGFVTAGLFQSLGMGFKSLVCTFFRNLILLPIAGGMGIYFGSMQAFWIGVVIAEVVGTVIIGVWGLFVLRSLLNQRRGDTPSALYQ